MTRENFNQPFRLRPLLSLLFFLLLALSAAAQQKVSSDDLLKQALTETNTNHNYDKALELVRQGLVLSPDYTDLLLLQARLHLLKNEPEAAATVLKKVLDKDPGNKDALIYMINACVALKQTAGAIDYASQYLQYHPGERDMQVRRVGMRYEAGQYETGLAELQPLLSQYPDDPKVIALKEEGSIGQSRSLQNRIGLGYSLTAFEDDRRPWNIYSFSYMRYEKYGTLAARLNYADRNTANGYQFEVEAYPIHGKSYSYITMSYSNSVVFPKYRFSYSYFFPQFSGWETEAGVRYIKAVDDYMTYVGALGKYFGPYWISAKAFISPNGGKVANAYTLSGRYYINELRDDYLTAIAGYGFSPDDRGRNFDFSRLDMKSARFTLGYQRTLWKRHILGLFGTWNNFRFGPGDRSNEYDLSVSYQLKF